MAFFARENNTIEQEMMEAACKFSSTPNNEMCNTTHTSFLNWLLIATVLQREVLPDAESETSDDLSLGTPSPRFLIRSLSPSRRNGDSSIDEARGLQLCPLQKRV